MANLSTNQRQRLYAALGSAVAGDAIADILDAIDVLSATEAGYIDSVTAGTSAASKAIVLDSNEELDSLGKIRVTDTLIATAAVKTLNATPVTVIAAPGASVYTQFLGAYLFLDFGTAAYDGIAAGEDLALSYTDASGDTVSATIEATGFMDAAADALYVANPIDCIPVANAVIALHMLTGEIATGDSPLKVRCFHRQVRAASLAAIA